MKAIKLHVAIVRRRASYNFGPAGLPCGSRAGLELELGDLWLR